MRVEVPPLSFRIAFAFGIYVVDNHSCILKLLHVGADPPARGARGSPPGPSDGPTRPPPTPATPAGPPPSEGKPLGSPGTSANRRTGGPRVPRRPAGADGAGRGGPIPGRGPRAPRRRRGGTPTPTGPGSTAREGVRPGAQIEKIEKVRVGIGHPGVLLKDPGVLLKDPGAENLCFILSKEAGGPFKRPRGPFNRPPRPPALFLERLPHPKNNAGGVWETAASPKK